MGEHPVFWVVLASFGAGFALLTVLAVNHSIGF